MMPKVEPDSSEEGADHGKKLTAGCFARVGRMVKKLERAEKA
jgi:hypothetical protein